MNHSGNLHRTQIECRGSTGRKHIVAAQSLVGAQQSPAFLREILQRSGFAGHHVLIEFRWTADGLAGVVDNEIEAGLRSQHVPAERLDARRMAQVEAEDFEAMAPILEIRLPGVAGGGISWKAGGNDKFRSGP